MFFFLSTVDGIHLQSFNHLSVLIGNKNMSITSQPFYVRNTEFPITLQSLDYQLLMFSIDDFIRLPLFNKFIMSNIVYKAFLRYPIYYYNPGKHN